MGETRGLRENPLEGVPEQGSPGPGTCVESRVARRQIRGQTLLASPPPWDVLSATASRGPPTPQSLQEPTSSPTQRAVLPDGGHGPEASAEWGAPCPKLDPKRCHHSRGGMAGHGQHQLPAHPVHLPRLPEVSGEGGEACEDTQWPTSPCNAKMPPT